jgi:hypothetical protein
MAMAHWGVLGQGSFGLQPPNSGNTDRMTMVTDEASLTQARDVIGKIAKAKSQETKTDIGMAGVVVAWAM